MERLSLGKALGELQAILGVEMGWLQAVQAGDTRELYKVGLTSRRVLLALGDVNLSDMAGAADAIAAVTAKFGGIDALFNIAGTFRFTTLEASDAGVWRGSMP